MIQEQQNKIFQIAGTNNFKVTQSIGTFQSSIHNDDSIVEERYQNMDGFYFQKQSSKPVNTTKYESKNDINQTQFYSNQQKNSIGIINSRESYQVKHSKTPSFLCKDKQGQQSANSLQINNLYSEEQKIFDDWSSIQFMKQKLQSKEQKLNQSLQELNRLVKQNNYYKNQWKQIQKQNEQLKLMNKTLLDDKIKLQQLLRECSRTKSTQKISKEKLSHKNSIKKSQTGILKSPLKDIYPLKQVKQVVNNPKTDIKDEKKIKMANILEKLKNKIGRT